MKIKKPLLSFLNQIIPVMIGVYLGFALNNFGQDQKTKNQFKAYKTILKTEVSDNLLQLAKVQQYHLDMRDSIRNLQASESIVEDYNYFMKNSFMGFRPALFNNSAYETGIQTGMIQEFKLETVQAINKTYTMQEIYFSFTQNIIQSISARKLPESEKEIRNALRVMEMNFNDFQSLESISKSNYLELEQQIE
jgi:hypothetical protein